MIDSVQRAITEMLDKPVEDFARKELVTLDEATDCSRAARIMREKGVESIVVTSLGKPVGIVTEKDLVHRVLAEGLQPDKTKLGKIMSAPLVHVPKGTPVRVAIALMAKHGFRRLAIVDDGNLIGVISQRVIGADLKEQSTPLAELELPKGVRCPYCYSQFPDTNALSKHIDRVHIGSGLLEGNVRRW